MRMLFLVNILMLVILFGCAKAKIEMDVRSYSDASKANELGILRTFSLAPTRSTFNHLKEKELLFLLKNKLVSKGYIYAEKNPDFIVSVDFSTNPVVRNAGTVLFPLGGLTVADTQTYISYHRSIKVIVISPDGTPLWEGEVESTGSTSDILAVAPTLLDELLNEFPYKTGKSIGRSRHPVK